MGTTIAIIALGSAIPEPGCLRWKRFALRSKARTRLCRKSVGAWTPAYRATLARAPRPWNGASLPRGRDQGLSEKSRAQHVQAPCPSSSDTHAAFPQASASRSTPCAIRRV
jgi:hypothetical protein